MPDILEVAQGVAPNATSDMPVIEIAAPVVDEAPQSADTVETGDKPGDATAAEKAKPDQTDPAVKRELTRLRNLRRAAEERAATAERQLSQALELGTKTPPVETRPRRDQYDNPEAWDEALERWARNQSAEETANKVREEVRAEAQRREAEQLTQAWNERKQAFMAEHDDYEDVAEADDLQISLPMAHAILNDELGPQIAYYLGQNPDEAARISKLAPISAAAAIGRIAQKLSAPAPRPRPAPKTEPLNPVGARSTATTKAPEEMSTEEYAASIRHRLQYGPRA